MESTTNQAQGQSSKAASLVSLVYEDVTRSYRLVQFFCDVFNDRTEINISEGGLEGLQHLLIDLEGRLSRAFKNIDQAFIRENDLQSQGACHD